MSRTLSEGNSTLVAQRKLLQGGSTQAIYKFATKGNRQSELQRLGFKLRNLAFFVWEHASLGSLNSFLSFAPQLSEAKAVLLASCIPPAPQQPQGRSGSICWVTVLGGLVHIWRAEIADGCDTSYLLIWREIFSFHYITDFSLQTFLRTAAYCSLPKAIIITVFFYIREQTLRLVIRPLPPGLIRCWQRGLPGPQPGVGPKEVPPTSREESRGPSLPGAPLALTGTPTEEPVLCPKWNAGYY